MGGREGPTAGDPLPWHELFDRAAAYEVSVTDVTSVLRRRRARHANVSPDERPDTAGNVGAGNGDASDADGGAVDGDRDGNGQVEDGTGRTGDDG